MHPCNAHCDGISYVDCIDIFDAVCVISGVMFLNYGGMQIEDVECKLMA